MFISYINDPYDPSLNKKLEKVEQTLKKEKGFITTTNLEKAIVRHDIIIEKPEKIADLISNINYIPVSLTLNKPDISDQLVLGSYLEGVRDIIKIATDILLDTPVEYVEMIEMEDIYIFNPITELGESVFINPNYISDFYDLINPDQFLGYTLFNTSLLTRYVLERWYNNSYYVPEDINVKYIKLKNYTIPLIPIGENTYLQNDYNKIRDNMDMEIRSLERQGYFGYRFGIHDLEDIELVKELCLMWNIKIVDESDFSILILQTNTDFSIRPEEWLRKNTQLIKAGQFPIYTLRGEFQYSYYADYQRRFGQVYKDVILKYVAYLAYADLSDQENELISPFISLIQINEDLSINISIPTIELADKLVKNIENMLEQGISGVNNKTGSAWLVEPCKDLQEGIIKRWLVQNIDNNAYPMLFKDVSGNEIMVFRSRLGIKYPSPFNFSKEHMEKSKKSLLEALRKYYSERQVCHDNLEPVELEKISTMTLNELLRLIPVTQNKITYCFSLDTLSNLDKFENPLTRQPFSENTLLRMRYLEEGWRGLFDIGPIYGLYDDVPVKINIPTTVGITEIKRIRTDSEERKLKGLLFLVEVFFRDETIEPLFEISLPTVGLESIDQLREYVDKLWKRGYFLNYWTSAVQKYIVPTKTKSYSVIVVNDILRRAGDSIFDGNIALEMLRRESL